MASYHEALREWKRAYWLGLIAEHDGNITSAAKAAGTNRQNVYKILDSLAIAFPKKRYVVEELDSRPGHDKRTAVKDWVPTPPKVDSALAAFARSAACSHRLPFERLKEVVR